MNLDIKLGAESLRSLEALGRYPEILEPNLRHAMDRSVEVLYADVVDNEIPLFKHPTGQFEGSLHVHVDSPYQARLWSDSPYGQRLHFGFSGETDALGRYYPEWPAGRYAATGYRWATRAIEHSRREIKEEFQGAIEFAHYMLGRSAI